MAKKKKPVKKSYKKFIRESIKHYIRKTFTAEYGYKIFWMKKDDEGKYAEIDIDTKYLNFIIKLYPKLKVIYNDRKRDAAEIICHEISHLLTEPMYDLQIKMLNGKNIHHDTVEAVRERQTQRISNAIFDD